MIKKSTYQICSKTVLDTTVPDIFFDSNGVCNFVKVFEEMEKEYSFGKDGRANLELLIKKIKHSGKSNTYDCIMGVSGGTDSTYALYLAVKNGLKPLAVHFDNGWNSATAVENIKNTCKILDVNLYTYVVDWNEFKNLQVSFLKASVSDAEIPTDIGIHATLIKTAAKHNVKYVLNGHSFRTEFIMPLTWTYMDGKYINSVHRKFGSVPLKTYPNFTLGDMIWFNILKGIKVIPFLNYFEYEKEKVKPLLESELNWKYYGGHHHESVYTKFFQSYLLPVKFKIDKRKTELSAMILSGHATKENALREIEMPYTFDEENIKYVLNKLDLSKDEFNAILTSPLKSFKDYPTYYPLIKIMKPLVRAASKMGILPKVLYYKFFA
jgi:N-acetyl sugar amidotransferase